jgi:hypothetical protein
VNTICAPAPWGNEWEPREVHPAFTRRTGHITLTAFGTRIESAWIRRTSLTGLALSAWYARRFTYTCVVCCSCLNTSTCRVFAAPARGTSFTGDHVGKHIRLRNCWKTHLTRAFPDAVTSDGVEKPTIGATVTHTIKGIPECPRRAWFAGPIYVLLHAGRAWAPIKFRPLRLPLVAIRRLHRERVRNRGLLHEIQEQIGRNPQRFRGILLLLHEHHLTRFDELLFGQFLRQVRDPHRTPNDEHHGLRLVDHFHDEISGLLDRLNPDVSCGSRDGVVGRRVGLGQGNHESNDTLRDMSVEEKSFAIFACVVEQDHR